MSNIIILYETFQLLYFILVMKLNYNMHNFLMDSIIL
jgi:hypothetical protein